MLPARCAAFAVLALAALAVPQAAPERVLLQGIRADSLKGHVSFLASDALEGRRTYTRGLDLAAEYIAARFRSAGLVPGGDKEYFQTAKVARRDGTEGISQNVIGILPGTDPVLKDTYVIVTAHYDHLGTRGESGDTIYNGANDDASGTAAVMEMAEAFARSGVKLNRSIMFMCFYGEEMGLVGSRYFGKNPTVPLKNIVANINMEQIGRTDDTEGPRIAKLAMTGFDYSDLGPILDEAAKKAGVRVEKHPQYSDAFFSRSDNQAMADVGIPAHTVCTAFEFPDYHRPSDHWDKLDYANMEKVVRALALGVLAVANSERVPQWNAANPKAAKYLEAWKRLQDAG